MKRASRRRRRSRSVTERVTAARRATTTTTTMTTTTTTTTMPGRRRRRKARCPGLHEGWTARWWTSTLLSAGRAVMVRLRTMGLTLAKTPGVDAATSPSNAYQSPIPNLQNSSCSSNPTRMMKMSLPGGSRRLSGRGGTGATWACGPFWMACAGDERIPHFPYSERRC
eukprot:6821191-Prymnesium_polylepis.1